MHTPARACSGQQVSAVEQEFWASAALPYLEVRTTQESSVAYAPHFHQAFFVGLIMKGETLVTLGEEQIIARQGDMVLVAPEQVHSCNPIGACPRSYVALYFDPLWCRDFSGGGQHEKGAALTVPRPLVRDAALFASLTSAVHTLRAAAPVGEDALWSACQRLFQEHCLWKTPDGIPGGATRAATARHAIGSGAYTDVGQVAQASGLRREVFIRSFRKATGLPPGRYQHCLRLEEGRRLLRSGMPIAEVAFATGYADQSHFHRMFVKYFAATPRQYRKNRSQSFKK